LILKVLRIFLPCFKLDPLEWCCTY